MEQIKKDLQATILQLFDIETEAELTIAPAGTGADYASNIAMKLTKAVGKAPREIAELIKAAMAQYDIGIAGPGFLNFSLPNEYFEEKLKTFTQGMWKTNDTEDDPTIVEFSDPNPFKVLHVGHLYTSMVGDSISRILEDSGKRIIRANFGGDVGMHVAKTLWSVQKNGITPENLTIEFIAGNYVSGTNAYEEDESAKAEIVALNKKLYEISETGRKEGLLNGNDATLFGFEEENSLIDSLSAKCEQLYGQDAGIAILYWYGRYISYEYFKDFYARIGVKFDRFYPESTVADRGLKEVKAQINQAYTESNGAIVYQGEKCGLHTRVFINQEGVPTYEAKDVGLIFSKYDDYNFARSIVITGNEQKDYMKVVLASVNEYAPELVDKTTHLTHGLVKLPGNEKMSSRKGNFIRAVDVLGVVREELIREQSERNKSTNSDPVADVDEKLVLAAIKYAFLRYKMGGDIIFDPRESVSMTGNSGIYLLYSAVRAKKILQKIDLNKKVIQEETANNRLKTEQKNNTTEKEIEFERALYKKCIQYEGVLQDASVELAPYKICNFLYELAQEFSRFYENVQVAGSNAEQKRRDLIESYLSIMQHGLNLLGMEIPEEM